jgi:serine phosphatase RsbU (regulator of sigma subunit)
LNQRYEFWRAISTPSHATFLAGVFFMFASVGLLTDIARLGSESASRLVVDMLFSGGIAVAYVLVVRRPRWLPVLVAVHIAIAFLLMRLAGPRIQLTGPALEARLQGDTNGVALAIIVSFALLSNFVQREGTRYVRAHTEIRLATDIHRLLVPAITRRLGSFEFHGLSLPSGDVGGDLIDLVEFENGWIAYVADVSGHGVGAGVLMGMFKSAAHMALRIAQPIDRVLTDLNAVLLDLKRPDMYVTFAGLQFDGTSGLQFSVAGHPPILRYQASTGSIGELSIAQVPVAMFPDRTFETARTDWAPGDLFVILTDGLTDVFDRHDREFGLDRVKALVVEHAGAPLQRLQERLIGAAREHGRQIDDQTLLLIRACR